MKLKTTTTKKSRYWRIHFNSILSLLSIQCSPGNTIKHGCVFTWKMGQTKVKYRNIQFCCHSKNKQQTKTILTLKNLVKDSENLWLYAFLFCKILTSLIYNSINYLPISAHITLKQDKNIAAKGAIYNSSTWHL